MPQSQLSRKRLVLTRSLPLTFALLGALALTACATPRPQGLQIEIPPSLRSDCERAAGADEVQTQGDLAAFSIRQEAAVGVCNVKREGLVNIIDEHNRIVTPPRPWYWPF